MMRVDRYILSEWFKVFFLTLLVMYGLLLLSDMQNNLQDLLGYDATTEEILTYYAVLLPGFLPVVLPLSFMISLLFSLSQLHRNHEITALRAAGLSLFRITRSLWLAGFLLSLLLFQFNATVIPAAVEESRRLWNDLAFSKALEDEIPAEEVGLLYNLTFFNRKDGRLWFLNRFNEYNYRAYGITVSVIRPADGRELQRIVANEGYYDDLRGHWIFTQGRETRFDEETGDPVRSLPFERRVLDRFGEDPELMKYLEQRPRDLSLLELQTVVEYLRPAGDPRLAAYAVTFYDRLFNPVSCLIILGLAIPFSVAGVRTNPFVNVSKAMGLFVLYYVLVNLGQLAGTSGFNPLAAALLPNAAAIVLIGFYFLRLQRP